MIDLTNFKCQLNSNREFQKAFLAELGKLGIQADTEEGERRNLVNDIPGDLFDCDFTTTAVAEWDTRYTYHSDDKCFEFSGDMSNEAFSLADEFRRLEAKLEIQVVDVAAKAALGLNRYGFQISLLKNGNDWDFNKFNDVLATHLPFVVWKRLNAQGTEFEKTLFSFSEEEGYTPFGPDEMDTLLQTLGVPDNLIDHKYRALAVRLKNNERIDNFSEWNTKVIPFKNGIYDPWTGTLRPYTKDDLVQYRMKAVWNPQARHPMVDELMKAFPDPEDRTMLKAALAITLVGNKRQNYFVQKGVTGVGKSTLIEAWGKCVLGERRFLILNPQHAFSGDAARFGCQRMDTAFMAYCDDLTNQKIKDEGIFKSLTGRNTVSIQHKGEDAYDAQARAVVIISSNAVPNFEDKTGALLRRCRFINRDYELKSTTFDLDEYIDDEDFASYLAYLVMEEFKNMIIRDETTGKLTYELPPESPGALKMREEAKNRGASFVEPIEFLLQEEPIIGMSWVGLKEKFAKTYNELTGNTYTNTFGNIAVNDAIHSGGLSSGARLQLFKKKSPIQLMRHKYSVRVTDVLAFSSLNTDENEKWGMYAVRYREVITGNAVKKCNELAETDPKRAQREWAKFLEAYNFTIEMIGKYYPDSVSVYEVKPNEEGHVPELAFTVPVALVH